MSRAVEYALVMQERIAPVGVPVRCAARCTHRCAMRALLMRCGAPSVVAQELFGAGDVGGRSRLLATMEAWLREERDERIANATPAPGQPLATPSPFANRHMAYFR